MKKALYQFAYEEYDSVNELNVDDALLLREAQKNTGLSYAPYSHFHVGAAARLVNGELIAGANQENASFPVGLCAERVLLATAATLHPQVPINSIAISYKSAAVTSNHPIAPCGICRQSLQELESRMSHPIRMILGGMEGKIIVIPAAANLLPFSFSSNDLG